MNVVYYSFPIHAYIIIYEGQKYWQDASLVPVVPTRIPKVTRK